LYDKTTLKNGVRVVTGPMTGVRSASLIFYHNVGSRFEDPKIQGVSHFLEHMLFKGGKRFGKGEITKEISRRGGALNAFTWIDCTAYFETLPAAEIDLALAIESDRIYDTRIELEEAEAERSVVISAGDSSSSASRLATNPRPQVTATMTARKTSAGFIDDVPSSARRVSVSATNRCRAAARDNRPRSA